MGKLYVSVHDSEKVTPFSLVQLSSQKGMPDEEEKKKNVKDMIF